MNIFLKKAIDMMLNNTDLQRKVFFFLAKKIVESTDNDLDDKLLEIIQGSLGEIDTAELEA